jgi:hypothetical protein
VTEKPGKLFGKSHGRGIVWVVSPAPVARTGVFRVWFGGHLAEQDWDAVLDEEIWEGKFLHDRRKFWGAKGSSPPAKAQVVSGEYINGIKLKYIMLLWI